MISNIQQRLLCGAFPGRPHFRGGGAVLFDLRRQGVPVAAALFLCSWLLTRAAATPKQTHKLAVVARNQQSDANVEKTFEAENLLLGQQGLLRQSLAWLYLAQSVSSGSRILSFEQNKRLRR